MRAKWLRAMSEFGVIVVGVLVALAADSWLEERGEAERAEAMAELMIVDLLADSTVFARLAPYPAIHDSVRATVWATPPDASIPSDSVVTLLRRLIFMAPYGPTRATFESLVAADGMRFLGDDSLQVAITRYYQGRQAEVTWWYDWFTQENRAFFDLLREVQEPSPQSLDEGLQRWTDVPQRLTRPWREIREDEVLMSQLWYNQIYEQNLGTRVERAQAANAELRAALRGLRSR